MNLPIVFLKVLISLLLIGLLSGCSSSEDRQAKYFQHAQALYGSGDYKKAKLEIRNVLQINPQNTDARYLWAQILEEERSWPQLHQALLLVVEQKPDFVEARTKLAQLYYHGENDEKAIEEADAVLAIDPDNADAHTVRSSVFFRQDDNKAAIKEAQLALASTPGHVGATSILAEIYKNENPQLALAVIGDGIARQTGNATLRLLQARVLEEQGDTDAVANVYKSLIAEYPQNFLYSYRLVKLYERHGRIDEAEELLIDIVEAEPENHQLKLWLAEFLANQRDLSAAEAALEEFIEKQPGVYELRFGLAKVYMEQRRYTDAEGVYRAVIALDIEGVDSLLARNKLAKLFVATGEVKRAVPLLEEILAIEPENSEALVGKARMELAGSNPTAAVPLLRTVVRNETGFSEALLLLAQAYEATGNVELALYRYREALATFPDDEAVVANVVRLEIAQEEFDSAEQTLNGYLERHPHSPAINLLRVMFYADLEQWQEAIDASEVAAVSDEALALGFYLKGRVFYEKGDFVAAIESYEKALAIAPEQMKTSFALAEAYQALGDGQAGLAVCRRALERSPDNIALLTLKAGIYEGLAEYETAAGVYETVLSIDSKQYIAANNLANILVDQFPGEENLRRALELTVDFGNIDMPTFWDTRGWVYYQNQDYTSALPLLKRALASDNDSVIFHYHLGMTHYRLHDQIPAKKHLELALKNGEVFTGMAQAREILAGL